MYHWQAVKEHGLILQHGSNCILSTVKRSVEIPASSAVKNSFLQRIGNSLMLNSKRNTGIFNRLIQKNAYCFHIPDSGTISAESEKGIMGLQFMLPGPG